MVVTGGTGVTIDGVVSDTEIAVFTDTGLTTVTWEHEGGEAFKIGGFGASVPEPGELIQLDFDLQLEDGDGDTVLIEDGIVLNLSPDDHLIQTGGTGADALTAGTPDQAETLVGLAGDDTLVGNNGNDILVGGLGSDTMTGNTGSDTYLWLAGDAAGAPTDTIIDFDTAEGDVLHLSALLEGETGSAANLDTFLNFAFDGNNTEITVDTNGAVAGGDTQTIVLQDVNLVTGAANDAAIIQSLLDSGSLVTDV